MSEATLQAIGEPPSTISEIVNRALDTVVARTEALSGIIVLGDASR